MEHRIIVETEVEAAPELTGQVTRVIEAALKAEQVKVPCEISVLFTDNDGIQAINREMPVSYTHLDVYKRQQRLQQGGIMALIQERGAGSHHLLVIAGVFGMLPVGGQQMDIARRGPVKAVAGGTYVAALLNLQGGGTQRLSLIHI